MVLIYISAGLLVLYSLLILFYRRGWMKARIFLPGHSDPVVNISVIIPARNEENNIAALLLSLQQLTYPAYLFEVIVVDDHSEDNTAAVVKTFPSVKLLQLDHQDINSYKKRALETGIAAAAGELIVTTDADCIVPENWLSTIAAFKKETNAVFIAAPVVMRNDSSLLQTFQALDFMVLQGITAASIQMKAHNMCNGANLAYERKAFYEVGGFGGIDHIASGDDMLLMQKISKHYPGKTYYLLSDQAIVETAAAKSWKEFFNQRIRWASKATHYNDIKIFSTLFLVYFFNCALLAEFIAGFWVFDLWLGLGGALFLKIIIELFFLSPVAKFYNKKKLLVLFPFYQPLHIIYTVIAGWLGVFGSFEWKGRRVK